MRQTSIIGIVLVKNEDLFITRALTNILPFCDRIIVADNLSSDATPDKIKQVCDQHEKIEYHRINRISASHDLIKEYAGQDVWIFGVDGDEIYDPAGLASFRNELLAGRYADWWMIFGNVLHCNGLDREKNLASGYLSPPCRSMTKLYNFGAIESWQSSSGERLHGGEIIFKPGYNAGLRCYLHEETSWEDALFRCVHVCFLQRSSAQKAWKGQYLPRPNPADILSQTRLQWLWTLIRRGLGLPIQGRQEWKQDKFTRGELKELDVSRFFGAG
jgi:glycosyltransferase involved in cell wall biosynthesis